MTDKSGGRKSPGRAHIPLGVMDQLVSSASNLAFMLIVARSASVQEFGAFAMVYLTYGLGLGALRAVGGDILLLTVGRDRRDARGESGLLLGAVIWCSCGGGVLLLIASRLFQESAGWLLVALAVTLPGLLVQDCLRYCLLAQKRAGAALLNDLLWLVVQALLFAVILLGVVPTSPAALLVAWGAGACVAAVAGLFQVRLLPARAGPRLWVHRHRDRIWSLLGDFFLMTGTPQVAMLLVGFILGLPAVAGLRAAQLIFVPFHSIFAGLRVLLLPGLAEAVHNGHRVLRRRAGVMAGGAGLIATAYAIPLIFLPDAAGRALFGATWATAEPLVWALALVCVARTLSIPVVDALRALGGGRRLIGIRLLNSLVLLGSVCGLAVGVGVGGAALGLALSMVAASAVWWIGLIRATSVSVPSGQRPREHGHQPLMPG